MPMSTWYHQSCVWCQNEKHALASVCVMRFLMWSWTRGCYVWREVQMICWCPSAVRYFGALHVIILVIMTLSISIYISYPHIVLSAMSTDKIMILRKTLYWTFVHCKHIHDAAVIERNVLEWFSDLISNININNCYH